MQSGRAAAYDMSRSHLTRQELSGAGEAVNHRVEIAAAVTVFATAAHGQATGSSASTMAPPVEATQARQKLGLGMTTEDFVRFGKQFRIHVQEAANGWVYIWQH